MECKATSFEVKVTPNYKKRAPLEPSPIVVLERFKGTSSLSFKDVKVGASSVKGLWIENPNDCIITVMFSKLPPAERGIVISESEFVLHGCGSHRIEVTWSPTCEGSWRDIIQVQVWGLPPPHLSFRVALHLTSVQPKIKRKCCQMALPPLRAHNAQIANMRPGLKMKANVISKCCRSHSCHRKEGSKENIKRIKGELVIGAEATKRNHTIDRDSLEEVILPGKKRSDIFAPVDGGLLPPCNVPSTPIRRTTYNVNGDDPGSASRISNEPSATFTVPENSSPKRTPERRVRFLEMLEGNWLSPLVFDKTKGDEIFSLEKLSTPGNTFPSLSRWSLQPESERCSTEVKKENVAPLSGVNSARFLFQNSNEKEVPNQSSPLFLDAVHSSASPPCSPIRWHNQDSQSKGLSGPGYPDYERRPYVELNVNHTYVKEIHCETRKLEARASFIIQRYWRRFKAQQEAAKVVVERRAAKEAAERLVAMQRASVIIQRNWRRVIAERQAAKEAADRLVAMQRASVIIQRNWRRVKAERQAAKEAAERLVTMQRASVIIQRNWRRVTAERQAAKEAAEKLEAMQRASVIIQRNWRRVTAERQAAKEAAERLVTMQRASVIIQRNWRRVTAERQAAKEAAEWLVAMHRASVIIQRNWRRVIAERQAAKEAADRLVAMQRASVIIQRNWRRVIAERQAAKEAAERLVTMQRASVIIQRNWRRVTAERQAAKEAAEKLEAMQRASVIIQRNWRRVTAERQAAKEAAERLVTMQRASVIIQRNWRRVTAERQAAKEAAEWLVAMHRASVIIQRNWRRVIAERQAAKEAADRLVAMQRASVIIQRNWRRVIAERQAAKEAAERLVTMQRASVIIQRNWRRVTAERQAAKEAAEKLEAMQRASVIIQRNWRRVIAERQAAKEAAERLVTMQRASVIIQRNWRRVTAERQAAKEAAEKLEAMQRASIIIQRNWRRLKAERRCAKEAAERRCAKEAAERLEAMKSASVVIQRNWRKVKVERQMAKEEKSKVAQVEVVDKNASTSDDIKIKFFERFHLKPRAYELLCELAALHSEDDLSSALKHIQDCVRNGGVETKKMCDKTTQTDISKSEFVKPAMLSVRKSTLVPNVASISNSCRASRRSLMNAKRLRKSDVPLARSLSPIKRRNLKGDLPEKESWSSVAEAVGRKGFPYTKKTS